MLSAGRAPADHASEVTIASLAEIGIDDSAHTPRRVSDNMVAGATVVVAMKPGLQLPTFAGVTYETWDLPDPGAWDVDAVRPLRDHIDGLVGDLLDRVLADPRDRGTPRHTPELRAGPQQ